MPTRARRSERAEELARDHPEAAPLLDFYRDLLEIQEPLSEHRSLRSWGDRVSVPPGADGSTALRLDRLPVDDLLDDFRRFLEDLVPAATPVLKPVGRRLATGPSDAASRTLEAFLAGRRLEGPAGELGCTPFQLAFFPRAFLQPVAEGLASLAPARAGAGSGHGNGDPDGDPRTECPVCGHPPVVGLIADEQEVENRRRLVCSLCATAWPFPRLTCPACGETEPDLLGHYVAEEWPHLRLEECESCGRYLKTADLREDGHAVPVVDDLASPELDVWADDQELRKIHRNVLGI
ncbi:MAG: formate dehydrogenase accessory protein FdhE [Gemmatimonadota bacterium]